MATINAIDPGLSATLIDDGRRAASVGGIGAVSATSIKGVERTIPCAFDQHGDMWQTATGGTDANDSENVIVIANRIESDGVQTFFLSFQASPVDGRDIFFINNAVYALNGYEPGNDAVSQAQGPQSHVCHWHNTLIGQRYTLRTDMAGWQKYTPDANCEYFGNVYREFRWDGVTPTPDNLVIIRQNHFLEGTVPAGAGVSNNTTGGSWNTAFPNIASGDFTPAGALAESLITPAVAYDMNWSARAVLSARGAAIAASESASPEPVVSNFTIRIEDAADAFADRAFSITTHAA
ncbi:MAG: hypothetical protein ABS87_14120 [Sphingomonas sp. SCN 67-18]|uniref:hypothetical protein n=1 Tax=uncultured Sphingomonas sp. TaxID=158754 RepID=UPI00086AB42E|nr:hypothetical protein [Sphingomonas sp. SCN 67-18]ODU19277.1 MAG: hypothetical protein ABS87_14120 [Sphingomonas sp. SCN 67-18]